MRLRGRPVFFVWATRERGTRSAWMARELGIDDVRFVGSNGRGFRKAPVNYPAQLIRTLASLLRRRPRIVFVQSPPTFAAWTIAIYSFFTGASFVIDAHSDAFERARWTRPAWITRFVARRALVTIVTNEHWASRIESWGASAMTIPTIPTALDIGRAPAMGSGINVAVVNTWAADEPLDELLSAAEDLPEMSFFVTGHRGGLSGVRRTIPSNVTFTGFLSQADYHGLLGASDVVACLTTRDHTMQNGACEAMFVGTPILTSDWPVLRDYFAGGAMYVNNTAAGIRDGLRQLMGSMETYRRGIREVAVRRQREWEDSRRVLMSRIDAGMS
jgi:glycosyltransferase involved in cell wall biosynthesis